MNNIEWKDGAVCCANGEQWQVTLDDRIQGDVMNAHCSNFALLLHANDFQLNEMRTGDFIPASKLDTEQKYNEVVEVLGLFGIDGGFSKDSGEYNSFKKLLEDHSQSRAVIHEVEGKLCIGVIFKDFDYFSKRQLTYNQLIAIGKLKRLMNERKSSAVSKVNLDIERAVKSKINTELDKPTDNVKSPSHYQLIEGVESIEVIARSMTQEQFKGYCLGNMLKYRLRAGKKDALQQDIDKANFYGELYEMHKEKCYDN